MIKKITVILGISILAATTMTFADEKSDQAAFDKLEQKMEHDIRQVQADKAKEEQDILQVEKDKAEVAKMKEKMQAPEQKVSH